MGNYENIEIDFIERTLNLISQYDSILHKYEFEHQYNYTLLLNCLLGIVVFPKEKSLSYIPNDRITDELKKQMGLVNTSISEEYKHLRKLIIGMRHAVAHFSVEIRSNDENRLIDNIVFTETEGNQEIINFAANELLPFIRYYAGWLQSNLQNNKHS
jgi:hypothetical protein